MVLLMALTTVLVMVLVMVLSMVLAVIYHDSSLLLFYCLEVRSNVCECWTLSRWAFFIYMKRVE